MVRHEFYKSTATDARAGKKGRSVSISSISKKLLLVVVTLVVSIVFMFMTSVSLKQLPAPYRQVTSWTSPWTSPWTGRHSPQSSHHQTTDISSTSNQQQLYIRYSLEQKSSYKCTYCQAYTCKVGTIGEFYREPLADGLQPLLNFTTTIHTNLKILVMGASVAIQIGQLLEEAMKVNISSRQMIHESWRGNEGITTSSTTVSSSSTSQTKQKDGEGGALANYRITGMFLAKGEGRALPNRPGGGWSRRQVDQLLNHSHLNRPRSMQNNNNTNSSAGIGTFDVMVFRIPHGWITFEEITKESVHETVRLARSIFGIHRFLFIDVPHINNVKTMQDMVDREQTNLMLQEIADSYRASTTAASTTSEDGEGTQMVVLKFGRWTDQLMEYNARAIAMIPADEVVVNKSYSLQKVGCPPKHAMTIAQTCAELLVQAEDCQSCRLVEIVSAQMVCTGAWRVLVGDSSVALPAYCPVFNGRDHSKTKVL